MVIGWKREAVSLSCFLCAHVFWRVVVAVCGCKSSADNWEKSFTQPMHVVVTQPWSPQVQQYQQALLQQQMLAQQRAQQVQSPEYITSPQDFAPALISYPRSLPVHGGTVADPPYPTNRWELWLSWALGLLLAYIASCGEHCQILFLEVTCFGSKRLLRAVGQWVFSDKGYFRSKGRQFNRWAWYNF